MIYIMRGIPGSGKSTIAKTLSDNVVSADNYFMVDGEYQFDISKIGLAHQDCLTRYLALLLEEHETIVVDNTNIRAWEIAPYLALAPIYHHEVMIVNVDCDVDVAIARGTHGVPAGTVKRMYKDINRISLPPHWNSERMRGT